MLDVPRGKGARERMGDFNAVLCADGQTLDSGYTFEVAPGVGDELRILKQGEIVARNTDFRMPRQGHNRWAYIRAQKDGSFIRLFFEGQLVLEYEDPEPLPGGYCGVWTEDNGILVPKVTIYHEERGGPLLPALG